MKRAKPILKWIGGKRWVIPMLADSISEYLTESGGALIDPFFGGGALPLWIGGPMIVGDACYDIIETYEVARDMPGELAWTLSGLAVMGLPDEGVPGGITKEAFDYIKKVWRPDTPLKRAARFMYMNRLTYNGMYRVNRSGTPNMPYAAEKYRPSIVGRKARDAITSLFPNKAKIHEAGAALAEAEMYRCDFAHLTRLAGEGDVLVADPPYAGQVDEDGKIKRTFDGYTPAGFSDDDQARLADEIIEADAHGAIIFAFNADVPLIRDLYDGFDFIDTAEKRQINSDTSGRGGAPCVIITNRPDMVRDGTETSSRSRETGAGAGDGVVGLSS